MMKKKTECSPLYRITSEQQFTHGRYKRPLFKYFPSDFVSSYCSEVFDISRFLATVAAPIAFVEQRAYTVDCVSPPLSFAHSFTPSLGRPTRLPTRYSRFVPGSAKKFVLQRPGHYTPPPPRRPAPPPPPIRYIRLSDTS